MIKNRFHAKTGLLLLDTDEVRFFSPEMAKLLQGMLCLRPDKRISSVNMLKKAKIMANLNFQRLSLGSTPPPFVPDCARLNCDPTYELEEMIVEAKPLHKKKKRLQKQQTLLTQRSIQLANAMVEEERKTGKKLSVVEVRFLFSFLSLLFKIHFKENWKVSVKLFISKSIGRSIQFCGLEAREVERKEEIKFVLCGFFLQIKLWHPDRSKIQFLSISLKYRKRFEIHLMIFPSTIENWSVIMN